MAYKALYSGQTNKKYEKLMDIHQDLSNNQSDFFSRNLISYR